ncbi:uncharacterized protein [Primulina huaijiensis]|uniref:uncharacterized protein n=1 Tax=Primulina huaijiensis TaxID=1492673 RepID=UPI003CC7228A
MATNNFNDPLFLHPSDAPGMTIVSEQLTGVENYGIWSRAMLIALRAKNKIAFIDGTCVRPVEGSVTLNQWERCNALVLSWIMNSVLKSIFSGIVYSSDASVVWSDLKDQFDKVNGSRIFSIHREFGKLTQGNNTISVYFCKLKQLWDEYSSLVIMPSCECAAARKYVEHDQQHRLLQFLMGLNDSYMHVRSQILMMKPLPSVSQAFSLLSQEESHRMLSSVDQPTSIFYARQGRGDERRKEVLTCEHCGWNGHIKAHCFMLIRYPPGHKFYKPQQGRGSSPRFNREFDKPKMKTMAHNVAEVDNEVSPRITTGAGSSFTPAQYAEILQLLGGTTLHSSNINDAKTLQAADTNVVNMAGQFHGSASTDWIIDTGTNEHMTGNYSLLRGPKFLCSSPSSVRLPNGVQLLDCKSGRIIWIGRAQHGLYYLSSSPSQPSQIRPYVSYSNADVTFFVKEYRFFSLWNLPKIKTNKIEFS